MQVVAALRSVIPSATLLQAAPLGPTTTPRQLAAATQAQYQHPPLGVPFSPAVMLPGQVSGGSSLQVAIRCWDSEWSGPLDVPAHQAVGTSAYSYLTLKQVRRVGGADDACMALCRLACADAHVSSLLSSHPTLL